MAIIKTESNSCANGLLMLGVNSKFRFIHRCMLPWHLYFPQLSNSCGYMLSHCVSLIYFNFILILGTLGLGPPHGLGPWYCNKITQHIWLTKNKHTLWALSTLLIKQPTYLYSEWIKFYELYERYGTPKVTSQTFGLRLTPPPLRQGVAVIAAGGNLWANTGGQMVRGCAVLRCWALSYWCMRAGARVTAASRRARLEGASRMSTPSAV